MLELFRYYMFIKVTGNLYKNIVKLKDIKQIVLCSFLCNLLSLIWYPAVYISILYHAIFVIYYFNEKYQIDIRKYRCLLDYMDNSSNDYMQIVYSFYRGYFETIITRTGEIEGRKKLVTVEEYVMILLTQLLNFSVPLLAFIFYTREHLDTIYILCCLALLFIFALAKKNNVVRFLHWFYFVFYVAFDDKLIVYPYICSLCLVSNEIFHFGFSDNLREIFGHKPTRYCKFCKDGLANNLLEGVLIDHNLIERRVHRDCYCRYVYQCQVRYWFDTIASFFASLYIVYWLEGNVKIWVLITMTTIYCDKLKKIMPNILLINYLIVPILLIIIGGFTDPMCSYFLFVLIIIINIYTNVLKVV